MEILQGIEHAELWPQIRDEARRDRWERSRREPRLHETAAGHGGVDGGRGASRASLGAEERKYFGFAYAAETSGAGGTEAGQSLEQRFGTGRVIEIFAGAGAHAGNDAGGLRHFAIGEDGNLLSGGANQFDGMDSALRVLRGNVDDDDFGARILELAKDGVGGYGGKPDVTENSLVPGASLPDDFAVRISGPRPRSGRRRRYHA